MGAEASGLTLPGGAPAHATRPPTGPPPEVDWVSCGSCRYRFAVGPVEKLTCPNCGADVEPPETARAASS